MPSTIDRPAAVAMFARSLCVEWGGSGVRANAIAAGPAAAPDSVAAAAAFLLSPASAYVTGSLLIVDAAP